MCLAVYIASDATLPELPWCEDAPAFHLRDVEPADDVRRQFPLTHVYYAGSHEGCGCGFMKATLEGPELAEHQENYAALGELLTHAIRRGAKLQLFTCWEDDQALPPRSAGAVTVAQVVDPGFELQELSLLDVQADA